MNSASKFDWNYKKLLAISIFLVFIFVYNIYSQSSLGDISGFARKLQNDGKYDAAVTEFYRLYFWSNNISTKTETLYRIGLCYRELEKWDKAHGAFRDALKLAGDDSLRNVIRIANATTLIVMGKHDQAQMELLLCAHSASASLFKEQISFLLITSAIIQHDWDKSAIYLNQFKKDIKSDELLKELTELIHKAKDFPVKSPNKAKWMSTFLPGSGQLYARDYKNAINAFLLNAINFTVTAYFLVEEDYYSAILYTLFLTERYYSGNRYQAQRSVINYHNKVNQNYSKAMLDLIKKMN